EGIIPFSWKHFHVFPLIKPGKDASLFSSFRPISLTNSMCKIMEKVVGNRLRWIVEKNNLLDSNQAGCRKERCTLDQITRLKTEATNAIQSGDIMIAVLLDFSRPFDLIWTDGF